MVKYRRFNLLADFASLGTFDVILCRNVLIYFDRDTKSDVLRRLADGLASDGYLPRRGGNRGRLIGSLQNRER